MTRQPRAFAQAHPAVAPQRPTTGDRTSVTSRGFDEEPVLDPFADDPTEPIPVVGTSDAGGPDLPGPPRTKRRISEQRVRVDAWFDRGTFGAGVFVMVLLALVGLFLFFRSGEAMSVAGFSFFTEVKWDLASTPPQFGVLGLLSVLARSGRRPRSPRRPTAPTAG
jgi:hypothetical protein